MYGKRGLRRLRAHALARFVHLDEFQVDAHTLVPLAGEARSGRVHRARVSGPELVDAQGEPLTVEAHVVDGDAVRALVRAVERRRQHTPLERTPLERTPLVGHVHDDAQARHVDRPLPDAFDAFGALRHFRQRFDIEVGRTAPKDQANQREQPSHYAVPPARRSAATYPRRRPEGNAGRAGP